VSTSLPVVRATAADAEWIVPLLTRAFDQDVMMRWLVRQGARRAERMALYYRMTLCRMALPRGEVLCSADRAGAAFWFPPGAWQVDVLRQVALFPDFIRMAGWNRWPEVLRGSLALEAKHPRRPHWYLLALGVDPARQGQGVGSALLRPILERCDRERTAAYLETSNERNVPLYQRHGFALTETWFIPRGGPVQYLMWREPRADLPRQGLSSAVTP
jgi:ribosomal protein S18 acetylase RimI-like enzyme